MSGGGDGGGYLLATRHPWPCLLFLLPLLLAYEGGILWLGASQPDLVRNGADTWMRWALDSMGLHQLYWAPILIVVLFLGWSWIRSEDRPGELVGLWSGMAFESIIFALGLWGLSLGLAPLLQDMGIELRTPAPASCHASVARTSRPGVLLAGLEAPPAEQTAEQPEPEHSVAQVVTFVGAGIYEELLFRLLLYTGLVFILRKTPLPPLAGVFLAAVASGALFAAAHHVGPHGEAFEGYTFLFRSLAGLYFALVFEFRGFGISVGAHACYDILVGVSVG
jgi:membrane protease YdiL (CAAX protease family)